MDHQQIEFFSSYEPSPMAVVAGTLCLMSCAMQAKTDLYVGKLIDNFNYLASCPDIDPSIRCVCRRMACHWESEQAEKLSRALESQEKSHNDDRPTCAEPKLSRDALPTPFSETDAADYVRQALIQISLGHSLQR